MTQQRPYLRQRSTATVPASVEIMWLREQVELSNVILDSYGVPRAAAADGLNSKSVALTLAGRLRVLLGDTPRHARHASPQKFASLDRTRASSL